ncbi:MAG: cytochrome d ubiquinol oxidase subunit II [Calditrichaceae bacterium]|nr:cytochrome d ubiquinol oxidase subunit II [Calditrichaceae bacterium]MBN2710184.1 cytochrome d ubiquinol oxidase subunit II [Calditrichaceae bacterium]RQV94158.1 MAG: cytochrome d ubiquinol oxidase subunit II [Calditrichota bacterium]
MEFTFDLNTIWFILIGILLSGYAILDGFDLGVGSVYLLIKVDDNRRLALNSIGPVWDGNEVWLVTGGGALFAAFPHVYATVFSGFYTAFMLLLFMLIFRAVAIEFRSKQPMKWWRNMWDRFFSIASILIAFLMGIALGNIVTGIPLGADMEFAGTFLDLISPYTVLVGITTVALFMMHGTIYLTLKTEDLLQGLVRKWSKNAAIFFIICFITLTGATIVFYPKMTDNLMNCPLLFIAVILNLLAIVYTVRETYHSQESRAFVFSSLVILTLMILFAIGIFPNLVLSDPNPEFSLNIYNAASSQKTLKIMLIIAGIGMPFVLAYTITIYRIFRGKVKLESTSY